MKSWRRARLQPRRSKFCLDFRSACSGRLIFLPQDNLNTDGIYGKDYTYREDMTPEMMAGVVMENYDPQFAGRTQAGDVIVGGFNFGTGSSREQAVTALKYKGIPLVIAGSFSQTYLRNAFNNGFLCIETPELVNRLRAKFADAVARKEKTIIPGDEIEVDFSASTIRYAGEQFAFPALGSVPQSLVIAGGVENLVSRKLGLNMVELQRCRRLAPTMWDIVVATGQAGAERRALPSALAWTAV